MTSSTPAASVVSSPMPNANQSNINALVNSTNNEQKLSKRVKTDTKLGIVFTKLITVVFKFEACVVRWLTR